MTITLGNHTQNKFINSTSQSSGQNVTPSKEAVQPPGGTRLSAGGWGKSTRRRRGLLPLLLTDCSCLLSLFVCLWSVSKADAHSGHPPALGHRHPDEQRHAYAGARRGVRLRVPGREGLHQLLLLLRGLPLGGLAPRPAAHPRRQDRLIRAHLLSHCLRPLQPGLLGLLPVPLGHTPFSPSLPLSPSYSRFKGTLSKR